MNDHPLRVLDFVGDCVRTIVRRRDLARMRTIKLDEASCIGGVKKRLRTTKVSFQSIYRIELAQNAAHLLWRVTMLDSIPHRLSVEHALTLRELANAEIAILELRNGDASCVAGGWPREQVMEGVSPCSCALGHARARGRRCAILIRRVAAVEGSGHV